MTLGSIDVLILTLRDEGYSWGRIARRLAADWGVEVTPETARAYWLRASEARHPPAPAPPPYDACGAYHGA